MNLFINILFDKLNTKFKKYIKQSSILDINVKIIEINNKEYYIDNDYNIYIIMDNIFNIPISKKIGKLNDNKIDLNF